MNLNHLKDSLGCTFNGIIHGIPNIRIDNFTFNYNDNDNLSINNNGKIKYFFLSHPHTDHLNGFKNLYDGEFMDSNYEIICTKSTKVMLSTMKISKNEKNDGGKTYKNCEKFHRLKTKPINTTFCLNDIGLNVTLIPNYHCIGSVMILIESIPNNSNDKIKRILYTGDVRFDELNLSSLKYNSRFLPFIRGMKKFDIIYLDTTFNYRKFNINILDNFKSMEILFENIEKYPIGTKFQLLDSVSGFEDVWFRLFNRFPNSKFVLDNTVKERFKLLLNYEINPLELNCNPNDSLIEFFKKVVHTETDGKKWDYKFYLHSGLGCEGDEIIKIKHKIDISQQEFEFFCMLKEKDDNSIIETNNLSGNIYELTLNHNDFNSLIELPKYKYILVNDRYLPMNLNFIYSRHSSLIETQRFIRLFNNNVNQVYPMTQCLKTWIKGFSMEKYYGHFCDNSDLFFYDKEMGEKFNQTPIPILNNKEIEYYQIWNMSITEIQNLELLGVEINDFKINKNQLIKKHGILINGNGNLKRSLTRLLPKFVAKQYEEPLESYNRHNDSNSDSEPIDPSYQDFIKREEIKQLKEKKLLRIEMEKQERQRKGLKERKLVASCRNKNRNMNGNSNRKRKKTKVSGFSYSSQNCESLLITSQDSYFSTQQGSTLG